MQNKVTFFNFHSPYFYFGFCRHMVYLSHYLTKTPTTTRIPEDPPPKKNSHYSSEIYCYFCRSLLGS